VGRGLRRVCVEERHLWSACPIRMLALIFANMIGRTFAVILILSGVLVGCGGHPSSGPIERFALCTGVKGLTLTVDQGVPLAPYPPSHVQPPADGVVISPPLQTVRVAHPYGVMILPPEGTSASEWHLVVVSGGKHICRETANDGPADLASLDGTSPGSVVLEATDSSNHRARVTLVFS
jgi:hypothetical protein